MAERQTLLKNLIGTDGVNRMIVQISKPDARLSNPMTPKALDRFSKPFFGESGDGIIGVSKGAEKLRIDDITAIGGWCALKTADMDRIRNDSSITDPLTGVTERIISVQQMAEWLERAIDIIQIREAVGIFKGTEYVAISEVESWGDRMKSEAARCLGRSLLPIEITRLEDALNNAELKRFTYTQRYLDYVTKRENNLVRVVDYDISSDLDRIRDEMLEEAGISLKELQVKFPNERGSLPGYSRIWGMYLGSWLQLLQTKGFITTSKGMIIEPTSHALGETKAKADVNYRIFGDKRNSYLNKTGINANLAFATFADVLYPSGDRMAKKYTVDRLPNPENWPSFLRNIEDDQMSGDLTLSRNPAFIWGVNLFPYGQARTALLRMVLIKDTYQQQKNALGLEGLNSSQDAKESNTVKVQKLKIEYALQMREQAQIVIAEMGKMFVNIFN